MEAEGERTQGKKRSEDDMSGHSDKGRCNKDFGKRGNKDMASVRRIIGKIVFINGSGTKGSEWKILYECSDP